MVKTTFILCVSVVLLAIHPSQGSFCTKKGYYYAAQHYCTNYAWWSMWCWKTAYRRITVADHWKECCPGYKGKDCTTPICLEPCGPGYICTSPDMCTLDPLALNNLYLNGTGTNSTITNSTDVGVSSNLVSQRYHH
uniref:Uncharacterized protein LOC111122037 n=1 Tax=Crassostrea virginica TaxID=6565 RepID=A0A8B8CUA4_CRAVI|nr:uncharacterized protein LOC111122037 [Crassostrea virginica]